MRALLPKFPAEALARIIDPEYGMISPDIFIPAAESKGFIIPFGDIVLDQVFKFISQHDNNGLGLSYIEINLSVAQCMEKRMSRKPRFYRSVYQLSLYICDILRKKKDISSIGVSCPE